MTNPCRRPSSRRSRRSSARPARYAVATMLAPRRSALAHDAYVLAEAVEAEIAAVRGTVLRRC